MEFLFPHRGGKDFARLSDDVGWTLDTRPTPWFWAINGAAGVLAAGIAVLVSIAVSISACLWLGAACYLGLALAAVALARMPAKAAA